MHHLAIWFNLAGAAIVAMGLVAALSRANRWPARLAAAAARAVDQTMRFLSLRKPVASEPNNARLGISSIRGEGKAALTFPPVDSRIDLAKRVEALEQQIRDELDERRQNHTELARELAANANELHEELSSLKNQIGKTKVEVLARLDEQARNGLWIAFIGALIVFAGAVLELVSSFG